MSTTTIYILQYKKIKYRLGLIYVICMQNHITSKQNSLAIQYLIMRTYLLKSI